MAEFDPAGRVSRERPHARPRTRPLPRFARLLPRDGGARRSRGRAVPAVGLRPHWSRLLPLHPPCLRPRGRVSKDREAGRIHALPPFREIPDDGEGRRWAESPRDLCAVDAPELPILHRVLPQRKAACRRFVGRGTSRPRHKRHDDLPDARAARSLLHVQIRRSRPQGDRRGRRVLEAGRQVRREERPRRGAPELPPRRNRDIEHKDRRFNGNLHLQARHAGGQADEARARLCASPADRAYFARCAHADVVPREA